MKNNTRNLIHWIFVAILFACVCLNIVNIYELVNSGHLPELPLPIGALVICVVAIAMNLASISND